MNEYEKFADIFVESFQMLAGWLATILPRLLMGLLFLLVGWLVARLLARLITKGLTVLKFDKLMERLRFQELLGGVKMKSTPSQVLGKTVYWLLMLLVLMSLTQILQLNAVTVQINALINYFPNVVVACVILVVGLFIASKLRDMVQTSLASHAVRTSKMIGNLLYYLLVGFVLLTVLEQLQFNIDLLTSNTMILLGGVALAFALGYGLSAREILPHILSAYYNKGMFQIGDKIRLGEVEGEILEMTRISVVIRTPHGKRFIPAKKLVAEEVEVLNP